jgi:transcriptional regulator with XRE-family HTH domain
MNTTQTAIARLESGNTMPSVRTLRKIAKATGHKLRIIFEHERPAAKVPLSEA